VILLYGRHDDPPFEHTLEAVQERDVPCLVLSQESLEYEGLRLEVGPRGVGGVLVVAGQAFPLDRIGAVFVRPLELPSARDPVAGQRARELHERFMEWLDVAGALVVNRPGAMQSNSSKPLQAQWIGAVGLRVPETLITSDPDEVRAFWRAHGRVVFKSISGVRSIVRELDDAAAARLDRLAALPTQFQAFVPGTDVRVHVVGERVFAAEIESSAVDYRYAAREGSGARMRAVELPAEIAGRCVELSRRMGLPLTGIDLRRGPDGTFTCFEVNPMPAYTFFEAGSGLPIGAALAELLSAHAEPEESTWSRASRTSA